MNNVWFMIPARAGSKTIPRKNIRLLGGKPLIMHVIETLAKIAKREQVIVSTDDEDVKMVSSTQAIIHNRSEQNADDNSTLDDLALEVAEFLIEDYGASDEDIFITIQPTSPFIKSDTIFEVIEKHKQTGFDSVITVKDDRHLRWTIKGEEVQPLFDERVNRQQMEPVYSETGGIISTTIGYLKKTGTRIGKNVSLIEVDEKEGLDIDTFSDWALAEYWKRKHRIYIRTDGGKSLGFGHLYRCLAIAQNIHLHDIMFVTKSDGEYFNGAQFLKSHHYPIIEIQNDSEFLSLCRESKPDIVINDILDTDTDYMQALKDLGLFVINFEDLGEGNRLADIVINDLYPDLYPQENHWYGVEQAILNPNFEMIESKEEPNGDVHTILLVFGGSDPSGLTVKSVKALTEIDFKGDVKIVVGPGYSGIKELQKVAENLAGKCLILQDVKNMAILMKKVDLAITSAGRTVTELMAIGVPTIAMCQNMREMRHNHASSTFGVINLGLGESVNTHVLGKHIEMFLSDEELRVDMYRRMKKAINKRSNDKVVSKMLMAYKNYFNEKMPL